MLLAGYFGTIHYIHLVIYLVQILIKIIDLLIIYLSRGFTYNFVETNLYVQFCGQLQSPNILFELFFLNEKQLKILVNIFHGDGKWKVGTYIDFFFS